MNKDVMTPIPGFEAWAAKCQDYASLAKSPDPSDRHAMRCTRLLNDLRTSIPLYGQRPEIAEAARATGCQDVLELVYRSLTPAAHIRHFKDKGPIDAITFGALLAFRQEYPSRRPARDPNEDALLVRYVLAKDDRSLFARLQDIDEQDILAALRVQHDLFEWAGPNLAPVLKHYLSGWVRYSPNLLLSVFLRLADRGHAKTINALLASGLNPLLQGNTAPGKHPIDPTRQVTRDKYPPSLVALLSHLSAFPNVPHHEKIKYPMIYAPNAVERVLASSPHDRINGLAKEDWSHLEIRQPLQ